MPAMATGMIGLVPRVNDKPKRSGIWQAQAECIERISKIEVLTFSPISSRR